MCRPGEQLVMKRAISSTYEGKRQYSLVRMRKSLQPLVRGDPILWKSRSAFRDIFRPLIIGEGLKLHFACRVQDLKRLSWPS
jgi:hypothetical protein